MQETVTFVGAAGEELAAVVRRPPGPVRGSVLMAHCFTCSKDLHTVTRLARAFVDAGWVTFAFDFTGLGESEGDFAETSVSTNVGDLRRAAVAMLQHDIGPCLLLGHSLGGAAAVLAARSLHTVDAVICIASPADVDHIRHLLPPDAHHATERFEVSIGGRPFELEPTFVDDLANHAVTDAAATLGRPMLVVEAGADTVVGRDQTRALAEAGNADLVVVEGGRSPLQPSRPREGVGGDRGRMGDGPRDWIACPGLFTRLSTPGRPFNEATNRSIRERPFPIWP